MQSMNVHSSSGIWSAAEVLHRHNTAAVTEVTDTVTDAVFNVLHLQFSLPATAEAAIT
jgi:hypothetical protein